MIFRKFSPFPALLFALLSSAMAGVSHAQTTQWRGVTAEWNNAANWSHGVPTASRNAVISVGSATGVFDPVVPPPSGTDTAQVNNLTVQSGGRLLFAPGPEVGVLVVNGTDKLQNNGAVVLGNGVIIFRNAITFLNGGTFDAGEGTLIFSGVVWDNKDGSTFTPGTSTVIFDGTSDQTVNGNITFHNVIANTEGTITFSGAVNIEGAITVSSTTQISTLTSWRVEGVVTRTFEGTETGIQQLMSPDNYVEILTPGITSITIESFPNQVPPEIPPGADTSLAVRLRYYQVRNVTGSGTLKLRLDYLPTETGSSFSPEFGSIWRKVSLGESWNDLGAESAAPNYAGTGAFDISQLAGYYALAQSNSGLASQFVITANTGANGSISPSGTIALNQGDNQSFSITPNEGYHIADVLVDGSSVGAVSSAVSKK